MEKEKKSGILAARIKLEKILDAKMIGIIKQVIPDNSLKLALSKLTSLKNKCKNLRETIDNKQDRELLEQQLNAIEEILNLKINTGEDISPEMILYYIKTACEHAENGNFINGGNISGENKDDGR